MRFLEGSMGQGAGWPLDTIKDGEHIVPAPPGARSPAVPSLWPSETQGAS